MRLIYQLIMIFIGVIIFCMNDELFIYTKNQYHGYIYMYKIEFFDYWVQEYVLIGLFMLMWMAFLANDNRSWIWVKRLTTLVLILAWIVIVNTSVGSIEKDGVWYRSPSIFYETQEISWKEVRNINLEIVRRLYGKRSWQTYGIITVKDNTNLVEIPFRLLGKDDQEKLIEVLRFLQQNDIQIKMYFEDSNRSEILQKTNKEFLDTLRTLTVQVN